MNQRNIHPSFRAALLAGFAVLSVFAAASPDCLASDTRAKSSGPSRPRGVFFLPGYPSDTEEAQPTLDQFSALLAQQLPQGVVPWTFSYHPKLETGIQALAAQETQIAMVSIHAFVEHRASHQLRPLLSVETRAGATERWSLVAAKGRLQSSADLAGFEIAGMPGYSQNFVRWVLSDWGALPSDVKTEFTSRMLSKLRQAARGKDVAVLLDGEQHDALDKLPFAAELEVVMRSKELPVAIVCAVGDRVSDDQVAALQKALLNLNGSAEAKSVLDMMRVRGFRPLDAERIHSALKSYDASMQGE